MPKIKKKFKNKFTTVANDFLLDKNLGMKERGLLITMLSLPDDWEYSAKGLAAILPNGINGVNRVLKSLEENQYLVRKRVYVKKKIADWEYVFSDSKLIEETVDLHHQNEDVAFEYLQNEDIQNVDIRNEAQLNTNKENKKELTTNEKSLDSTFNELNSLKKELNGLYEVEGMILNYKQAYDLNQLVKEIGRGEISSSKENLIRYVRRLYDDGFRDSHGEPINSLYGYVRMNFLLKTRDDKIGEELLKRDGFGYY